MTANQIRRFLLTELPSVAIEWVDVMKNTTVIPDSLLAHRLGLVPILTNPSDLQDFESGPESSNNAFIFKLEKTGVRDGEPVYSHELVWEPMVGQEKMTRPEVIENCLLFQLKRGQEISITCIAIKGKPKQHMKWSSVVPSFVQHDFTDAVIKGSDRDLCVELVGNVTSDYMSEQLEIFLSSRK